MGFILDDPNEKERRTVALVVPSIRENSLRQFIEEWGELGLFARAHLILVEDNPTKTFDPERLIAPYSHFVSKHFSWKEIDEELKEKSWIVPRRSDTVRSFGYWKAWELAYDYVLTLDDDVYPSSPEEGESFVEDHIRCLTTRTRWFNTIAMNTPRGVPYYNRGKNERVMVNHGLWTNVLDLDAPRQLCQPTPPSETEHLKVSEIVPRNSYFPMCGMNLMWKREATVLMYHLLMGKFKPAFCVSAIHDGALEPLPCDRFGDIHAGILMKKIVDELGYNVSTGVPIAKHSRASNVFANLRKEANWLEVNEKFWEYVDRWEPSQAARVSFAQAYFEMGDHVGQWDEFESQYPGYFKMLGEAMRTWAQLFFGKK